MANRDTHHRRSVLAVRGFRRLLGVRLSTPEARRKRWFGAGMFLLLDVAFKIFLTEPVQRLLNGNLAGPP